MQLDFDSGLIILIAAFDIFLIYRFFTNYKQTIMRGLVPSRAIMLIMVCVLVAVQTFRNAFTKYTLAFNIAVIFAIFLIWITRTGISKEGLLAGIMPTPWSKIYYYEIEPYSATKVRLRAHLASTERNLVFLNEQRDEVEAHLIAGGVLSFKQYKDLKNSKKNSK